MRRAVFCAFILGGVLKFFVFDLMIAEGKSMEPSIRTGTVLVVNRLVYGFRFPWMKTYLVRWALPRPGDVVIFHAPGSGVAVKRCVEIAEGHFMALGDNGPLSFDSRSYGPVPVDCIIGKALGVK
ncbi:MAG: S26 family signal peptidase [Treponema sp.]|nr:S26 family signal peptidase [Treponema sp.]